MKPLPHAYSVLIAGGPAGYATVSSPRLPDLAAAPPVEFDGPGDAWGPEQFLLAAVGTCFVFTLRAVARASGLDLGTVELSATGTLDREDGVTRFTRIVLRPRLTVPPGMDATRAARVLAKSGKSCPISASLATRIDLEPQIVTG